MERTAKKWPLVLFSSWSDHFHIINNLIIRWLLMIIPGLLTMQKWSDRKKNRTSGHFFLPYVLFLRSEMRKKNSSALPFFYDPKIIHYSLKIIQDYSWIIHEYSGLFRSFQDFSKIIQDYLAGTTIVCLELKFIHAYSRFFLIIQDYLMVSQNQWLKFAF